MLQSLGARNIESQTRTPLVCSQSGHHISKRLARHALPLTTTIYTNVAAQRSSLGACLSRLQVAGADGTGQLPWSTAHASNPSSLSQGVSGVGSGP
jgi:hypothetical protein